RHPHVCIRDDRCYIAPKYGSSLGSPDQRADGPREVDELARAFWVMVPHAAAGAALTWRILPTAAAPAGRAPQVPLGRLELLCAGVLCAASVANVGSTAGRVTLLAAAIAAIALMLRQDGAARDRLFPAQMLSLRQRVGQGFWMIFFVAMSTTPGSVYLRVTAAWGGVGCCRRA